MDGSEASSTRLGVEEIAAMLAALAELDARLMVAADAVSALFAPGATRDSFRGLRVTPSDVDCALGRVPVLPLFGPLGRSTPLLDPGLHAGTRMARLAENYGLSSFELDCVLIALAPEIDARYERIYAFIHDDVGKKRPSVDLVLNLLCASIEEKLACMRYLEADAPLLRSGLLSSVTSSSRNDGSRLLRALELDATVVNYLCGHCVLDARLLPFAEWVSPEPSGVADDDCRLRDLRSGGIFHLYGADAREIASVVGSAATGEGVLVFDVGLAISSGAEWPVLVDVAARVARLGGRALLLSGVERLLESEQRPNLRRLLAALEYPPRLTCLTSASEWPGALDFGPALLSFEIAAPAARARGELWSARLAELGAEASLTLAADVGNAFSLTRAQIAGAARHALHLAAARGSVTPNREEVFEGGCAQTRGQLAGLAERVRVNASWDDLVLPPDVIAHLRELSLRVSRRADVLGNWGFARGRSAGKGTTVLFAGPSGTGKTFAAAVLARAVGLDLYRIDLASVVSKYIGETEKNLARVFSAAERSNCVLLFDEAEALFGKRSEVTHAHDRYANQELSYLLQRVEHFEGLAILTTNLPGSIDEAFRRRLAGTVYFPQPDEAARRALWGRAWPPEAPLAEDVDPRFLGDTFAISGGMIAQAALGAAYLAAEDGAVIQLRHVLAALRREFAALGFPMPELALRAVDRVVTSPS